MNGYKDALDRAREKFIRENGGIRQIETRKYYSPTNLAPGVNVDDLPARPDTADDSELLAYAEDIPGVSEETREQARQAVRDAWEPGAGIRGRGMSAALGAAGLYSVMEDLGTAGIGLQDACVAFFESAKEIHQAAAREAIYGPDPEGPDLNEQGLNAIKTLNAAVRNAGLDNCPDTEYEQTVRKDSVMLFGQEICANPKTGDARDFILEFMDVAQQNSFTQDIEAELEQMGRNARVDALLYRDRDDVPEQYGQDDATRDAVENLACDLGV